MSIELQWEREDAPSWDGSGTVLRSWHAWYGHYACRIDEFRPEDGGGFAYTVALEGNPVPYGENESAVSWTNAESAIIALLPELAGYTIDKTTLCYNCAVAQYASYRGPRYRIYANDLWADGCNCNECGAVILAPYDDGEAAN